MADSPTKPRSALWHHLKAKGGISRVNPELLRLAEATGYTAEHIFKLATGRRKGSLAIAKALARESKNRALTVESFGPQQ